MFLPGMTPLMIVRAYVLEQFRALGWVEQHRFQEGSDERINLILRLPGREIDLAPLLVGAH